MKEHKISQLLSLVKPMELQQQLEKSDKAFVQNNWATGGVAWPFLTKSVIMSIVCILVKLLDMFIRTWAQKKKNIRQNT